MGAFIHSNIMNLAARSHGSNLSAAITCREQTLPIPSGFDSSKVRGISSRESLTTATHRFRSPRGLVCCSLAPSGHFAWFSKNISDDEAFLPVCTNLRMTWRESILPKGLYQESCSPYRPSEFPSAVNFGSGTPVLLICLYL